MAFLLPRISRNLPAFSHDAARMIGRSTPRQRLFATTTGLGLSSGLLAAHYNSTPQNPLLMLRNKLRERCDSANAPLADYFSSYQKEAKAPIITKDGKWNAEVLKQVSAGSILGLFAGMGISVFSKPLAILFGLFVLSAQALSSWLGVNIIPYSRLQRLLTNRVDVKSAVRDNVGGKVAFGVVAALAGFAEF